jgi:excisionase family DNA binding protein
MNTEHNQQSHEPLLTPIQVTFLTQAELAKALGVCRQTIVRWTQSEFIPAIRIGSKSVRYDLAEVRAHLIGQSKAERIEQELRDETTKHN